jgi:hypothetical protein
MSGTKVIALKRKRHPEFDGNQLLTFLFILILLLIFAARASAQAPVNDSVCNAIVINLGVNSPFTNVNATSQFGEPAITTGGCTVQNNWCSGEPAPQLRSTVWFKFTVPATGTGSYAFRVNGNAVTFDSQAALFRAATCADVTNGNAVRLAANDDSTGSLFNSYMTVYCLTPTVTYYLMVDGYGTTTNANFYVHVIELSDRYAVANAGSDQTICYSLFPQFQVNGSILGVAASTTWSTTGDGTFANPSSLSTFYTPGLNDKATGITNLVLSTNDPVGVCGISRDTLVLSVIPDSISGGADKTICVNEESISMTGVSFLFTSFEWTSTGDGTFDILGSLTAKYFPGPNDRLQPFVDVVLRGVSTQCFNTVYDTVRIFNSNASGAIVNLGADTVVCSSSIIALSAQQLSGYSSVQWTTSGDGVFSNPTGITTNYTLGSNDIASGVATVTLSAVGVAPCQGTKQDSKQLFIQQPPIINSIAGGGSYCATTTITLTADVEYYNDLHWTTSGDGSFTNPNDLITDYIPGAADLTNGFASLTLTADATTPCAVNDVESVNVTITAPPTLSTSIPAFSCGGDVISLNAGASNYQTISWSTSGNGSFDDPSGTKPKYTPGSIDISSGSVTFSITLLGNSPCNAFYGGGTTIIVSNPTVNAGADQQVCTGSTVSVNAIATNYSTLLWDTDGDGFFFSPSSASTIYIPGPLDYSSGSVNLFISADGNSPCTSTATDALLVTFMDHAVADAGPDDDIVAGQTYVLDGYTENASSYSWTTSGDGSFNNANLLNATYTPGASDILAGTVTLTLSATDQLPCNLNTTDQMILDIYPDALLALKLYIEGMYTFPGNAASLYINGHSTSSTHADTIKIALHDTIAPYNTVIDFMTIVGTNGIAVISIPGTYAGNWYYLSVKHRSSIETWTKHPVLISSFGLIDFTATPLLRMGNYNGKSSKPGSTYY